MKLLENKENNITEKIYTSFNDGTGSGYEAA